MLEDTNVIGVHDVDLNENKKIELFVVYDVLADEMGPIFQAKNRFVAYRQFNMLLDSATYPDDFRLYRVGYLLSDMRLVSCVEEMSGSFGKDQEVENG